MQVQRVKAASGDALIEPNVWRVVALGVADHQRDAGGAGRSIQLLGLTQVQCHWNLEQHVLARRNGRHGLVVVHPIRRGDEHGIDVRTRQRLRQVRRGELGTARRGELPRRRQQAAHDAVDGDAVHVEQRVPVKRRDGTGSNNAKAHERVILRRKRFPKVARRSMRELRTRDAGHDGRGRSLRHGPATRTRCT